MNSLFSKNKYCSNVISRHERAQIGSCSLNGLITCMCHSIYADFYLWIMHSRWQNDYLSSWLSDCGRLAASNRGCLSEWPLFSNSFSIGNWLSNEHVSLENSGRPKNKLKNGTTQTYCIIRAEFIIDCNSTRNGFVAMHMARLECCKSLHIISISHFWKLAKREDENIGKWQNRTGII